MAPQGSDPAYWICTFANNQHRVDLGTHWKKSILAEKTCTMVTMVTMACSRLTEAIEASEILIHMTWLTWLTWCLRPFLSGYVWLDNHWWFCANGNGFYCFHFDQDKNNRFWDLSEDLRGCEMLRDYSKHVSCSGGNRFPIKIGAGSGASLRFMFVLSSICPCGSFLRTETCHNARRQMWSDANWCYMFWIDIFLGAEAIHSRASLNPSEPLSCSGPCSCQNHHREDHSVPRLASGSSVSLSGVSISFIWNRDCLWSSTPQLSRLDFRRAEASVAADKSMILKDRGDVQLLRVAVTWNFLRLICNGKFDAATIFEHWFVFVLLDTGFKQVSSFCPK